MEKLMKKIEDANTEELSRIVHAVIRRYSVLYPEWEVVFYSLHRDDEQRRKEISGLIQMLTRELDEKRTPSW